MNKSNIAILVLIGILFSSCTMKKETMPPNILFIAVDDLRTELGCYGNTVIKSPNIDQLAHDGVLFSNHFVNVPTCGASRHSLLTGMRPISKDYLRNDITELTLTNKQEQDAPETFIHHLKRNGYHTVGIGKISHSADGYIYGYNEAPSTKQELPNSWDELDFDYGKWKSGWNAFFGYANGENRQSLKRQVKPYEKGVVNDTGYVDGLTTKLAISKLNQLKKSSKPFFLGIGFFRPHLPFNAPKKYWDLYDRDSIPISPNPMIPEGVNLKSLHESGELNGYKLGEEKASLNHPVSEQYARTLRHAYYACVSYIDNQIGHILKELNKLGLDKNTIVVVWGDHGWHLGDQQMWGKHTIFENALKSPLIIKVPNKYKSKSVNSIIETVDIYPGLMELCNIKLPDSLDGKSFVSILEQKNMQTDNVAYSYYRDGISLRTNRYRLTKYYRKEEPTIELYDHNSDPFESKNISNDNKEIVEKLIPILEKGNKEIFY
ncbi:sulfatase [Aestuariibaculum suncheonense]|uniref:Sulfatase n=2 Tax=Aestuariibaculum suncheonense TaxID=1028745 RepID=A0A8J6UK69_9FLAO|nr:sulfatase [Aestuariibaculum suncheonense]